MAKKCCNIAMCLILPHRLANYNFFTWTLAYNLTLLAGHYPSKIFFSQYFSLSLCFRFCNPWPPSGVRCGTPRPKENFKVDQIEKSLGQLENQTAEEVICTVVYATKSKLVSQVTNPFFWNPWQIFLFSALDSTAQSHKTRWLSSWRRTWPQAWSTSPCPRSPPPPSPPLPFSPSTWEFWHLGPFSFGVTRLCSSFGSDSLQTTVPKKLHVRSHAHSVIFWAFW